MAVQHVVDALGDRLAFSVVDEDLGHGRSLLWLGRVGEVVMARSPLVGWQGDGAAGREDDPPPPQGQPQQMDFASAVSMLSTPSCGSSVTRATPVSKKSRPSVGFGLVPSFSSAAMALTPSDAIFSGYC